MIKIYHYERNDFYMITGIIDSIKRERARVVHELSFVREMAKEDVIADRVNVAESQYVRETLDDIKNANDILLEMPEDKVTDLAEIEYLLEATEDVDFNDMIMNAKNETYINKAKMRLSEK